MVFLFVLEELVIGLFLVVVVTQVIIPLLTDRPLFPTFKRKSGAKELAKAKGDIDAALTQQKVKEAQAQAERLRKVADEVRNSDKYYGKTKESE